MRIRPSTTARKIYVASLCLAALGVPAIGQAQSNPPAWSTTAHYAVGDLVSESGNIFRCIHAVTAPNLDPAKAYSFWQLFFVGANTTVVIGTQQTFPNFTTAWSYILPARIADNAILTLSISSAHGAYAQTFGGPFSLDHAFGAHIAITADYLDTNTFTFTTPTDGFTLDTNHTIGSITNLSLYGTPGGTAAGIRVSTGASIGGLHNCWIQDFDSSLIVSQNANVTVFGSYFEGFSTAGAQSTSGATINFPQGAFVDNTTHPNRESAGLFAMDGGHIWARKSNLKNLPFGAISISGGNIDIENSTITNCVEGCYASIHGFLDCENSSFSGDGYLDIQANYAGIINALYTNATLTKTGTNDASIIFR